MEQNGSSKPIFDTDDQATYFLVTLPAHEKVLSTLSSHKSAQDNNLYFNTLTQLIDLSKEESVQESAKQSAQQSTKARELLRKQAGRYAEKIITLLQDKPLSKNELLVAIGLSNHLTNKVRHIDPLLATGWISYTVPENPTDKNQKYKITNSGKRLLQLISQR